MNTDLANSAPRGKVAWVSGRVFPVRTYTLHVLPSATDYANSLDGIKFTKFRAAQNIANAINKAVRS
jgi:hypothetical protein